VPPLALKRRAVRLEPDRSPTAGDKALQTLLRVRRAVLEEAATDPVEQARKRRGAADGCDVFEQYQRLLRGEGAGAQVETNEDQLVELMERLPFDDDKWDSDSEDNSIDEDKVEQASDDEDLAGKRKKKDEEFVAS